MIHTAKRVITAFAMLVIKQNYSLTVFIASINAVTDMFKLEPHVQNASLQKSVKDASQMIQVLVTFATMDNISSKAIAFLLVRADISGETFSVFPVLMDAQHAKVSLTAKHVKLITPR
jgi:hypothetical protein